MVRWMLNSVIWRGRRLDRAPAARRLDRKSLLREVSIESSAELCSAPPELLHHTRYYIQSPYPPWPSFLVADAHPHLAMTSLLLRPSLSVRFCAVAAPPFWRLVPGLFHPLCPNVLIRWILPRVSARYYYYFINGQMSKHAEGPNGPGGGRRGQARFTCHSRARL